MISKDIIKLASSSNNFGLKNDYSHKTSLKNSLCGDKITLELIVKNKKVSSMRYETEACIYCEASASLLSKKIKNLYLKSLATIGIDVKNHDIRFVEDDWESPTLGAAGLGWEVWCDGMEITQFTYFQQMTGIECKPVPVEITYGLERLCMFVQGKNNVFDLDWNYDGVKYKDIFFQAEKEFSAYNFEFANTDLSLIHI